MLTRSKRQHQTQRGIHFRHAGGGHCPGGTVKKAGWIEGAELKAQEYRILGQSRFAVRPAHGL